jgi:hypothetical protein
VVEGEKYIHYSKNCNVCNHPRVDLINQQILNGEYFDTIAKRFPEFSDESVRQHWRNHLAKDLKLQTRDVLEAESFKRRDSLQELTGLFDDIDEIIQLVKENISPDGEDFSKMVNSARGLFNVKKQLIEVNARLIGDDEVGRNMVSLTRALKGAKDEIEKKKKSLKFVEVRE